MRLLGFIEHTAWHYHKVEFLDGVTAAPYRLRIFNLALAGLLVGVVGTFLRKIFGTRGSDSEKAIWFDFGRIPFVPTICKSILAIISVGLGTSLAANHRSNKPAGRSHRS